MDDHRKRGVEVHDDAVTNDEPGTRRVVGRGGVRLALFVDAPRNLSRAEHLYRFHSANHAIEHVAPAAKYLDHDVAEVLGPG